MCDDCDISYYAAMANFHENNETSRKFFPNIVSLLQSCYVICMPKHKNLFCCKGVVIGPITINKKKAKTCSFKVFF